MATSRVARSSENIGILFLAASALPPFGAGPHHICIVAPTTGTGEPLTPIGSGSLGAVSSRHFGGIGLNPMAALPGPHNQANTGSRRIPEGHRGTGFGFHLTPWNAVLKRHLIPRKF
jgi:hypothetical protein